MKNTSEAKMIELLNKAFPGIIATPRKEFDESSNAGIWFRGSESCLIEDMPAYDAYGWGDTFGTHPKLEALLQEHNWYSEGYDAGTLMAYPN